MSCFLAAQANLLSQEIDPNLFRLDWERLLEVLATIVVLSLILERALAVIFESKSFIE